MRKNWEWWRHIVFLSMTCVIFMSCDDEPTPPVDHADTIQIGFINPYPAEGEDLERRRGSYLAITEINAAGGIFDKPLELVVKADQGSPEIGVRAAEELLALPNLAAISGAAWSGVTLAIAQQVTIPHGITLISPSATSPLLTNLDDQKLVWRTCPSDAFQGKVAATYAFDKGRRSVGIIYRNTAYSIGLAKSFKAEFEQLAGHDAVRNYVIYDDLVDYTHYDFTPKVDSLFVGQPDLIYLVTYEKDGAMITHLAKSHTTSSYFPLFMGCDGNSLNSFIIGGEPTITEEMIGTRPAAPIGSAYYQHFIANYKARYGREPISPYAANSYDNTYLIAYAMLQAGRVDSRAIAGQLADVATGGDIITVDQFTLGRGKIYQGININYEGASGKVDFDENGDVVSGTYEIWRIENGQFVTVTTIGFP